MLHLGGLQKSLIFLFGQFRILRRKHLPLDLQTYYPQLIPFAKREKTIQ
jgi:hypothetical protein